MFFPTSRYSSARVHVKKAAGKRRCTTVLTRYTGSGCTMYFHEDYKETQGIYGLRPGLGAYCPDCGQEVYDFNTRPWIPPTELEIAIPSSMTQDSLWKEAPGPTSKPAA